MKPCNENNGAVIYVGRGCDRAQSFVLMFILQLDILTGTFYWSVAPTHFKLYCGWCTVKAEMLTKTYIKKKFVRLHNR